MMTPPVVFPAGSDLGRSYVEAMTLAGRYAYAGRDVVVDEVLGILGATADVEVHNNHNFAWLEEHGDETAWVVRKGATPAFPGQLGFVGATMSEPAVILEGVDSPASKAALYSTIHGAGRAMSRTQAAGKIGTRMDCGVRDCANWVSRRAYQAGERCPDHPKAKMFKRRGRIKPGRIDFAEVRQELPAERDRAARRRRRRGARGLQAPRRGARLPRGHGAGAAPPAPDRRRDGPGRTTPTEVAGVAGRDLRPFEDRGGRQAGRSDEVRRAG